MRRLQLLLIGVYRRLPVSLRRFVVRRMTPAFTVGAICLVERDDGRLLLVRHSYRQRWGTPGGLLARGEVPAAAAVREATEEVGIQIELLGRPTVVVDPEAPPVDDVLPARRRRRRRRGGGLLAGDRRRGLVRARRATRASVRDRRGPARRRLPRADARRPRRLSSAVRRGRGRWRRAAARGRSGGGAWSAPWPRSGGPARG